MKSNQRRYRAPRRRRVSTYVRTQTPELMENRLLLTNPGGIPDFLVNTTDDVDNGSCTAAHCSLREAINAANQTTGHQLIGFSIPISDEGRDPNTGVFTILPL